MLCYRGRTFCASPDCRDACGSRLTPAVEADARRLGLWISQAFFCGGEPSPAEPVEEPPAP